jgi:hypothetical protein
MKTKSDDRQELLDLIAILYYIILLTTLSLFVMEMREISRCATDWMVGVQLPAGIRGSSDQVLCSPSLLSSGYGGGGQQGREADRLHLLPKSRFVEL